MAFSILDEYLPNVCPMENANVSRKDTNLVSVLETHFKGKTDINIFMPGIVYQGVAFSLLFSMLKKRGNSNSQERLNLIERYIKLFKIDTIDCIVADREFVGGEWLKYLNNNKLRYYIRIRNNFKVFVPGKTSRLKHLGYSMRSGKTSLYITPTSLKKRIVITNDDGNPEASGEMP